MTGRRRQLAVGLLALPLSVLPFVAYGAWSPQGRLLADEIRVRVDPPQLPELDATTAAELAASLPSYEGAVLPLVYHGVGSDTDGEGDYALSPEQFGEHLAALRAAGMSFVTGEEVAAAFEGGRPLPRNAVLLTFDDGRSDALLWATPLLEQAEATATMFVITDASTDGGPYYGSWGDLLRSEVWDLQAHTADLHHRQGTSNGRRPALTSRTQGETVAEWRRRVTQDLDRADDAIAEHSGRAPVAFAYPFGSWGGDPGDEPLLVPLLLDELGEHYAIAFHQDDQDEMTLARPTDPRLGLRRLEVGDWSGAELIEHIEAAVRRTPSGG